MTNSADLTPEAASGVVASHATDVVAPPAAADGAPVPAAQGAVAAAAVADRPSRFRRLTGTRRALFVFLQLLIVGIVLGYVVASIGSFLAGGIPILGGSSEIPEARAFMTGLIEEDSEALFDLQPKRNVLERAIDLKGAGGEVTDFKPVALRFLGGDGHGAAQVQIYAVEFHSETAGDVVVAYSLTLIDGKVVRVE
jgi:hypothetical protein